MSKLTRTPPYYGSKSCNQPVGKWIISLLPWERESVYCEPFAGMLGVLLGRQPVASEIINDLDSNLTNWWRCVRDEQDELARLIALTPWSREVLQEMGEIVNNPPADISPVRRALALHVVLEQGLFKRMVGNVSWRLKVDPSGCLSVRNWTGDEIAPLAARLKYVQIENRDALKVIERVGEHPKSVIYCDPPYPTAHTLQYKHREIDVKRMAAVLKECKGRVAISGYRDEWDCLGWERYEKSSYAQIITGHKVSKSERVEVLWLNYTPPVEQRTLDL